MFKLLTRPSSNAKTSKALKFNYAQYILHLAPADLSGVISVCPKATPGCKIGCLNTAGRGGMFKPGEDTNIVQQARIRKTKWFATDRESFLLALVDDITKAIKQATKKGLTPVFRLNGTSDISWEKYKIIDGKTIFELFPHIQFYDYTKVLGRKVTEIPNYHLTFSRSENNDYDVMKAMLQGYPIAMVFDKVPESYKGIQVFDGDATDLRFLDVRGIIGLKAKGRARKDTSGFVIRTK